MGRKETTSLLNSELIRLRLTRKNSYSYWAHEVLVERNTDHEKRVDFVEFLPKGGVTYSDGPHVEHGTFAFYEVKSCVEDLKSGHGLNFYGDENWLVMPVELYDRYKELKINDPYVRSKTRFARCLLYGTGKNGRPTFWEQDPPELNERPCRKRGASELLFAIMRAMVANSGHSDVDHSMERT
jgi:hypothetical protein